MSSFELDFIVWTCQSHSDPLASEQSQAKKNMAKFTYLDEEKVLDKTIIWKSCNCFNIDGHRKQQEIVFDLAKSNSIKMNIFWLYDK